jgi:hypothetical protein
MNPPSLPRTRMDSNPDNQAGLTRRGVLASTAWIAPVLLTATAAPLAAASTCQSPSGLYSTRAGARLLHGSLAGVSLNAVTGLTGSQASNSAGSPPIVTVAGPATLAPLSGAAAVLSGILTLADANLGVVHQFARANRDGGSLGAVGAVSDSGSITLNPEPYAAPDLARVELKGLLENLAGAPAADLVGAVSDVALVVGAVGARSEIADPCAEPVALRQYLMSHLALELSTPAAGALVSALTAALPTLAVDTSRILGPLSSIPLLGGIFDAANISVSVSITADALLQPLPGDGSAALTLDAEAGTASLDLSTLFGGPYVAGTPGWLNGLAPNTALFASGFPVSAVSTILDQWVSALLARLASSVAITVTTGSLKLSGTLAQFASGTATFTTGNRLTDRLLGGLMGGVMVAVAGSVEAALEALLDPAGVLSVELTAITELLSAALLLLSDVLALTVNAQNHLPGALPSASTVPGQFEVTALHVGVIGAASLLALSIGHAVAGPNVPRA